MTQNLPEYLNQLELSKSEGIQSILTLFNLMTDPSIIYDSEKNRIITANNAFFLISNLEENDFIGKPIKSILPNTTDIDPITGHGRKGILRHKRLPFIPIKLQIFTLTQSKNLRLILLKPEDIQPIPQLTQEAELALIENLNRLIQKEKNSDINSSLQHIMELSSKILSADLVCLYKASGIKPQIERYFSNNQELATELPNILMTADLVNSNQPIIWKKGSPPRDQLQKSAESAGFNFITIVPMGQEFAKFGLFIAAGMQSNPNPSTLPLAKLITAYTAYLIEDQFALTNIRNIASKIKQVVKIQNEIIANLDEGIIILSPDLSIAEINPAAETILGYANLEAVRQPIESILITSESLGAAFKSAQQGIPTLTGGDLMVHHRNGNSFPAQVMVTPVMHQHQLLSIIVLIRDMSQQQQNLTAKQQLEQRAILGEVTAIFAHEVRNPINAIMLSLQVIEDNISTDDENRKWIDNIRDECNKLLYLMESVLSFAKPLEYKMSEVDLDFLLSRILERWHPRFLRLNINSFYESTIKNPRVEGDLRALEQVFTNLISNSVNAMSDDGGSLGIKISEPDQEEEHHFYQITLTDTGHGIPDEIKSHMFKPFVTGSSRGTGLGLAITQRIINAHKGKIEVDSFPGGTIFKIFLAKKKGLINQ